MGRALTCISQASLPGCSFREVGRRERVGKLGDVWRDVLLLERRSDKVGLDQLMRGNP